MSRGLRDTEETNAAGDRCLYSGCNNLIVMPADHNAWFDGDFCSERCFKLNEEAAIFRLESALEDGSCR